MHLKLAVPFRRPLDDPDLDAFPVSWRRRGNRSDDGTGHADGRAGGRAVPGATVQKSIPDPDRRDRVVLRADDPIKAEPGQVATGHAGATEEGGPDPDDRRHPGDGARSARG